MIQHSRSPSLDLPFSLAEYKFFTAVIAVNLALDAVVMWVEHWFITLSGGRNDIPSGWMEGFGLACLIAQIVVLSIWAALFAGSNLLRVLLSTLVVCAGFYLLTWLTRQIAPAVIDFRSYLGLGGLALIVVIFFTVQVPFWILRFLFGWRIVRIQDGQPAQPERHRFSMLQMLGWMAFLSVPLGLGQVHHGIRAADSALIIGSLAIVSWLYGLPYLWATLGAKRLVLGLAIYVLLSVGTTLLGWRLYQVVYTRASTTLVLQAFMFVQAGAAIIGLGTGIAARLFGYQLTTHARNRGKASGDTHLQ